MEVILKVLVVQFHHTLGPTVEFVYPPFENNQTTLPDEWSFMPFQCLPDGAHSTEEEYIYFHLPPVKAWSSKYHKTIFGLACFRQMDSTDLINRPADVTRSKVQKSVVVLASECVLGSVRSKLGLVTQAFFAQRDFTKIEIIQNLFENLNATIRMPITDATLFMGICAVISGISLRELVFKFKQKTLQLFKLLLLGKRILFFGHKVERLSAYQYGLISLIPELLRNLHDVGAPELANNPVILPIGRVHLASLEESHRSMDNLRSHQVDSHKAKLLKLGHPLRIFGKGTFFQPYIPLQQIDVLEASHTKSFLTGTSNSIFTHNKTCCIDVIAHADTGNLEILNPQISALIALSAADKKFIDDIIKPIISTWTPDNDMSQIEQIDFEGSDDDIRARFEVYVTQLFASIEYDNSTVVLEKKIDYISEYNSAWVAAWKSSQSYNVWLETRNAEYVGMINPGHPLHGFSIFDSLGASFSAFSKKASTNVGDAVSSISDPVQQEHLTNSANVLMAGVSSWYSSKKSQWIGNDTTHPIIEEVPPLAAQSVDPAKELKDIQKMVGESKSMGDLKEDNIGSFEHINL